MARYATPKLPPRAAHEPRTRWSSSPKLTDHVRQELCYWLRRGAFVTDACHAVGIATRTFHAWMQRGERGIEPYASFARDVRRARAADALRLTRVIARARDRGDVGAAQWLLTRRYREAHAALLAGMGEHAQPRTVGTLTFYTIPKSTQPGCATDADSHAAQLSPPSSASK